jgi:predicted porin
MRMVFPSIQGRLSPALLVIATLLVTHPLSLAAQTGAAGETEETTDPYADIKESEAQEARDREISVGEDPIAQRQATKEEVPVEEVLEPDELSAYTSLRVRYRKTGGDGQVDDGGSRIGANGHWQFKPRYWLSGQAEIGFNILDSFSSILDPGSSSSTGRDEIFLRLLYVNLETPRTFAILGKAWSTYYSVAGFTDRFQGTGGSASGAFNAGTDGGPSGTGRADEVLQTRIKIDPSKYLARNLKPFTLNVQFQNNQEIPINEGLSNDIQSSVKYGYALGLSALLRTRDNFNLGIAYNRSKISDDELSELNKIGIDGDGKALLIGTRWFSENWYLATNFSALWNHMTTEDGIFFDGLGWETYAQYNVYKRWWAIGGWNYLKPNDNQTQAGDYQIKYGVLGLRYSFKQFNRMLYANVRFDDSTSTDGSGKLSNTYTVGIRWDYP